MKVHPLIYFVKLKFTYKCMEGDSMNKEKYRKILIVIFSVYLCTFIYYLSYTIYTFASEEPKSISTITQENDGKRLMPLGMPVGIYIRSKGIMVLDTSEIKGLNGEKIEPAKHILKSGDYILCFNEQEISSIEDFKQQISENREKKCTLTIWRSGKEKEIKVEPVKTQDEEYKLGIWVRQDAQGIGTVTFVDEEGNFMALGHGITDVDTGEIIEIQSGRLYESNILTVIKGKSGEPGEIIGNINYKKNRILGTIKGNEEIGIYGSFLESEKIYNSDEALQIAKKEEVKEGSAKIRCYVNGEIGDYDIEIEKVDKHRTEEDKNLVIRITDEALLKETNGIVQGMSGSPIVQNGKLVGAVTHVLVNDPKRGYGIFIENMLQEAK